MLRLSRRLVAFVIDVVHYPPSFFSFFPFFFAFFLFAEGRVCATGATSGRSRLHFGKYFIHFHDFSPRFSSYFLSFPFFSRALLAFWALTSDVAVGGRDETRWVMMTEGLWKNCGDGIRVVVMT